ncbi:glutamate racemase [Sporolactobacillus vineae]|uniref:glutamate racemase n=1 Tax=Sporolactobacillus vineae TaxID=444463 RepID=UPI0002886543|nr:glutamate racemase [Sporolactobacillus vineae]
MKIAVFDSGIGGITVLHQAMKLLPDEDYIFFADTAHVPYGEKPKEEVRGFVMDAADFLNQQHLKALVVACNTATSVAIDDLRAKYAFPVLGIEPAVKPAVRESEERGKKVLVTATRLTLSEAKYHHLVERLDKNDRVDGLPLPGLVTLAEKFDFDRNHVIPYLKEQLAGFDVTEYGTVVLGCTHFPFFRDSFRELFPEGTDIIDGGPGTARNLKRILAGRHQTGGGTGHVTYYRSGVEVADQETLVHYQHLLDRLDRLEK